MFGAWVDFLVLLVFPDTLYYADKKLQGRKQSQTRIAVRAFMANN